MGRGGSLLNGILEEVGLRRAETYITNTVKCRPPENRKPSKSELLSCLPFLQTQINLIAPKLIFTLGAVAFSQITGKQIKLRSELGRCDDVHGVSVCALYHPNGLRYITGGRADMIRVFRERLRKQGAHLE